MNVEKVIKQLEKSMANSKPGGKWTPKEVKSIRQLRKIAWRIQQVALGIN